MRVAAEAAGAPPDAVRQALTLAAASPSSRDWIQFLTGALLLLGAGLLLSGIVCFFAFNWADLGRFAKFGVLQAAVAICAGLGWWKLPNLSGRVALFAAAVLVGPLLGVYGQTYQTGADPWGLFCFWALLILPWVVVAHFTALWILTIALLDTALVLYWIQVSELAEQRLVHAVRLARGHPRGGRDRLGSAAAPRQAMAGRGVGAAAAGVHRVRGAARSRDRLVLDFDIGESWGAGLAIWVVVAAVFAYYSRIREDLFMLTSAGGAVMTVLTFVIGRIIFKELKLEMFGGLLMAMILIAEVTLGVAWLRCMMPAGRPHAAQAKVRSEVIARPPVGEILARILPDDAAARDRARAALETLEASGVPWYLRLLTGIGAWAGGGFMLSFITGIIAAILGANNFEGLAIILGLIVMAAAVMLRRGVTGDGVGPQFLRQLALVACFCGQMLFIGGVGSTTKSTEAAAVAALIASIILIAVYPDRIQRFCSTADRRGLAAGSSSGRFRIAPM